MFAVTFDMYTTINDETSLTRHKVYVGSRHDVRKIFMRDGLFVTETDGTLRRISVVNSKAIYPMDSGREHTFPLGMYDDRDVSKFLKTLDE